MHDTTEPTDPGFYYSEGARQVMVHLLDRDGQWWTWFDQGGHAPERCAWGYVEQSGAVFPLRRLGATTRNP